MRTRRAWTTTWAGIGAIAVTAPFLYSAGRNLTLLNDPARAAIERGAVVIGIPLQAYGGVLRFTTFVLAGLSVLAIVLGVNVLRRRAWAREGAMFMFGLFALSLPMALSGLAADPPAEGAWVGIAVGVVNIVVVLLLARQSTADDVEIAERDRRERREGRTSDPALERF